MVLKPVGCVNDEPAEDDEVVDPVVGVNKGSITFGDSFYLPICAQHIYSRESKPAMLAFPPCLFARLAPTKYSICLDHRSVLGVNDSSWCFVLQLVLVMGILMVFGS